MLNSEQISEWQAYDQLEPIGEWRADYRIGILCSLISQIAIAVFGKKESGSSNISPIDFMPDWAGDFEESKMLKGRSIASSPEEIKALFSVFASASSSSGEKEK